MNSSTVGHIVALLKQNETSLMALYDHLSSFDTLLLERRSLVPRVQQYVEVTVHITL